MTCLRPCWWHPALVPCVIVASWSLALLLSNFALGQGLCPRKLLCWKLGLHGLLGGGVVGPLGRKDGSWRLRGPELLGALVLPQVLLEDLLGSLPWIGQWDVEMYWICLYLKQSGRLARAIEEPEVRSFWGRLPPRSSWSSWGLLGVLLEGTRSGNH